jgi:hypothetical protein
VEDQRRAPARTEAQRQTAPASGGLEPAAHNAAPHVIAQDRLPIVACREASQVGVVLSRNLRPPAKYRLFQSGGLSHAQLPKDGIRVSSTPLIDLPMPPPVSWV